MERSERVVYGVGQLLTGLNALLQDSVGRVWVAGEVSNLHRARSGHLYFTLKDPDGQVRAALFRSAASRLPFEIEEGLEVLVLAEVSVYEIRGDLQLVVRNVEPQGRGALQLAFEQLRRRLEAEGLFDPAHKRELPRLPRYIGVVTSPTSAAVRDVIQVAGRRFPGVPLLVSPTRVQGAEAAEEVAAALDLLVEHGEVDVILLVRGGGSLEDLWAFNSEVVARAIARCPLPVVSGVGHEVDVTIADLVADLRAPTPSAAAELALPDRRELGAQLARRGARLGSALQHRLRDARARLVRESDALKVLAPRARLASQRSRLDGAVRSLVGATQSGLDRRRSELEQRVARLDSLSPLAVLARGYALVKRSGDGGIVRSSRDAEAGERISIRLADGELAAVVAEDG